MQNTILFMTSYLKEGARHRLAAITYGIVTDNRQRLYNEFLVNLAIHLQQAKEKGTTYPLPSLKELLQHSEFSSLRRWLDEWQVDVGELQGLIDGILSESGFTGL